MEFKQNSEFVVLGFQAGEQIGGVLGQPGEVASRPELTDEPGRVPRRSTRELLAFEQHDIGAITLGKASLAQTPPRLDAQG